MWDRVGSEPKYMKQGNARTTESGVKAADGRRHKPICLKAKKAAEVERHLTHWVNDYSSDFGEHQERRVKNKKKILLMRQCWFIKEDPFKRSFIKEDRAAQPEIRVTSTTKFNALWLTTKWHDCLQTGFPLQPPSQWLCSPPGSVRHSLQQCRLQGTLHVKDCKSHSFIQQCSLPSLWGPSFDMTSAVDRAGLWYSKVVPTVKLPWLGLWSVMLLITTRLFLIPKITVHQLLLEEESGKTLEQ